ncbi:MAG: chitobiase/beta-hexosaminidase C-terminal domain-containing protein, partial [Bacteroidales bacterium]|nr:chitobiase/beta-hexosaminidase C-terminal domain-containing protein [Bacteroidales bacterium]
MKNFTVLKLFSLLIGVMLAGSVWGQTSFTATFNLAGSGNDVTSFNYNGTAYVGISPGPLVKVGITSSSSTGNFRGSNWPLDPATIGDLDGTVDLGKYIGFTVAPISGYKFTITSITFGIGRSATGTRQSQWRGSSDTYNSILDNYTTLNASLTNTSGVLTNPDANSSWTGNVLTLGTTYSDLTSTVGFRLYMYNSEATTGTAGLQGNITINGTFQLIGGNPTVATPTFNPGGGNYITTQNVVISCETSGSTIYYTDDGTDPDETSPEYTGAVSISSTTTLKARAYADGYDPSAIATAVYTFPTEVANIAAFRAGDNGTLYKITGEVVILHRDSFRNRHFIRDNSGSLTIWDESSNITTSYNPGDGVTGFIGIKSTQNSGALIVLEAAVDPGTAAHIGLDITPVTLTIAAMSLDNTGNLATIADVGFDVTGTFATGQNYQISDGSSKATMNFRTDFFTADYIGTDLPTGSGAITGIVGGFGTAPQITSRNASDLDFALEPEYIIFYFRGPSWMDNNPHNPEIWGPFNGWASAAAMTFDSELGWWSVTVEVADAAAEITYQSRFAQAGTTKYQKAFENFSADPTFTTTT